MLSQTLQVARNLEFTVGFAFVLLLFVPVPLAVGQTPPATTTLPNNYVYDPVMHTVTNLTNPGTSPQPYIPSSMNPMAPVYNSPFGGYSGTVGMTDPRSYNPQTIMDQARSRDAIGVATQQGFWGNVYSTAQTQMQVRSALEMAGVWNILRDSITTNQFYELQQQMNRWQNPSNPFGVSGFGINNASIMSYQPYTTYNQRYNYNQTSTGPSTTTRPPDVYSSRATVPTKGLPEFTPPTLNSPRLVAVTRALETRQQALELSEASGDKIGQAINHAGLAQILVYKGDPEEAVKHLNLAEPVFKETGDLKQQADVFWVKGSAFLSSGAYKQALEAYRQALTIFQSLDDRGSEAEIKASMGWVSQSLGDVQGALNHYQQALSLFIKTANIEGRAKTQLAMGLLYQSLGEDEKATEQYSGLLPFASTAQLAATYSSVGQYYESHNNFGEALKRYEPAIKLIRSIDDRAAEAGILAGMGRCYMGLNDFRKAIELFEQAGVLMIETGNRAGEAGVIASLGEIEYRQGITNIEHSESPKKHFNAALKLYGESLSKMMAAGNRTGEIGVLTNTGLLYDAWEDPRQALTYYTKALQQLDDLSVYTRIEEFRIDLASQSANLYRRAILLEVSQNRIKEAFELSERARARAFLDQLGGHIDLHSQMPAEFSLREGELRRENISLQRQIGQELAKPFGDTNRERLSSLQLRLSVVRTEYENLLMQLKVSSAQSASLLSVSPLSLPEVQRQLGPDTTLVSYFTTPDVTLAFVITRGNIHCVKLRVTDDELAATISTFLDFPSEKDVPPSLKQLYKWLIAPIKGELRTSVIGIVPHGVLHNLPFASLTPDGNQYFADGHELFILPSVSVLPYLRARVKPGGNRILVLANNEDEGLPQLSHAYDEARAVASLFGTEPLLGGAATVSQIRTRAGHYDVLHLIAHIDPNNQTPQFARIMLARGEADEGPLELHQVYDLDLRETNLVVLSGCQSQLGRQSRGDDIVALNRAFIYAGASSVIASLWNVDDEATQQLMTAFYRYLKQGMTKAAALREAQREMRVKYPNPYYWAAFVLTGDPGTRDNSGLAANSGVPDGARTLVGSSKALR
jgi:CHAT domain-containing protein/tetratricopeptide (TPR) repeat protein